MTCFRFALVAWIAWGSANSANYSSLKAFETRSDCVRYQQGQLQAMIDGLGGSDNLDVTRIEDGVRVRAKPGRSTFLDGDFRIECWPDSFDPRSKSPR